MNLSDPMESFIMVRFTLRGLFGFVLCFAAMGGFYNTAIAPAAAETALLTCLRALGAEVTAVSVIPDELSQIIDRERLQRATRIDLKTPQATVVFLKSNAEFPLLESVALVGYAVDSSAVTKVSRRESIRHIRLDSTAVTLAQYQAFGKQQSGLYLERTNTWAIEQIDRLDGFPWNGFENPLDVIRIVNHLRSVGKDLAIETLAAYVAEHDLGEQTKIRRLMPMLFRRINPNEKLPLSASCHVRPVSPLMARSMNELLDILERADHIEGSHTSLIADANIPPEDGDYYLGAERWSPWRNVHFEGNVAFYVTGYYGGGYSLPLPVSSEYLTRWASQRGRLIEKLARPVHDPRQLADRVLCRFEQKRDPRYQRVEIAKEQIDKAINAMLGDLTGPTCWNEEMQRYEPSAP